MFYGNADYWYLIANTNGLTSDPTAALVAGMSLDIPARATVENTSTSFKPMQLEQIIGDTTPNLPYIPPPPKCNAIAMIVMIAVTVLVSVYAPGLMGMSPGFFAGFVGGFAGSVAGQLTGKALGVVESFSLRSALVSGITQSFGQGMAETLKTATWAKDIKLVTDASKLTVGGKMVMAAASVGVNWAANQLVGNNSVAFSWRNVVTSAAAAGVIHSVGEINIGKAGAETTLGDAFDSFIDDNKLLGGTAQNFLSAATSWGVKRGIYGSRYKDDHWNFKQMAMDAFGNALGSAIAQNLLFTRATNKYIDKLKLSEKEQEAIRPEVEKVLKAAQRHGEDSSQFKTANEQLNDALSKTSYAERLVAQIVSGAGQQDPEPSDSEPPVKLFGELLDADESSDESNTGTSSGSKPRVPMIDKTVTKDSIKLSLVDGGINAPGAITFNFKQDGLSESQMLLKHWKDLNTWLFTKEVMEAANWGSKGGGLDYATNVLKAYTETRSEEIKQSSQQAFDDGWVNANLKNRQSRAERQANSGQINLDDPRTKQLMVMSGTYQLRDKYAGEAIAFVATAVGAVVTLGSLPAIGSALGAMGEFGLAAARTGFNVVRGELSALASNTARHGIIDTAKMVAIRSTGMATTTADIVAGDAIGAGTFGVLGTATTVGTAAVVGGRNLNEEFQLINKGKAFVDDIAEQIGHANLRMSDAVVHADIAVPKLDLVATNSGFSEQVAAARIRQAAMLEDNVGFNISPTAWDQYPTIGRNGTFVSDQQGVLRYFGNVAGKSEMTVSPSVAAQIEKDMGLVPGTLNDGFKVRQVTGLKELQPVSPLEGNQYFLGAGNHLPGGAPEMVIRSIPTVDNDFITTILKVKVGH